MIKPSVGIIGCGWLGKVLAEHLIKQSHHVVVTVRTVIKQQELLAQQLNCHLMTVPGDVSTDHIIFQQDVLVIAITPGFKRGNTDYADNIKKIVQQCELSNIKKIILISSTGVYQGLTGVVDEFSEINTEHHKAQILFNAEQAVLNFSGQYQGQGQVLRLAGLLGEDREPGKFLSGKKGLAGANSSVNLIHQLDAVGLIIKLINEKLKQKVFVGVSQTNATKQAFYQAASQALGLIEPEFELSLNSNDNANDHRQVVGKHTQQWLNYQYQFDDLMAWLTRNIDE